MRFIPVVFIICLSLLKFDLIAQNDTTKPCKVRLPDVINNYQPALVPVLNLDGTELYFDRKEHTENIGGIRDKDDIWYSKRIVGNGWSEPYHYKKPVNSVLSDVLFTIMPDGRSALGYGKFSDSKKIQPGFCILEKKNDTWVLREHLNIKNYYNNSDYFYGNLSPDGKKLLLCLQRDDGYGELDLYISFLDVKTNIWSEPKNLGPDINTKGVDAAPLLAYDGVSLYFATNGRKGYGNLDLFVSKRLDDTWQKWSEPKNLGPTINTKYDENSLWLTALGDTAYIVSSDTLEKRPGIYYACVPKEFQPEPYGIIKGRIWLEENGKLTPFLFSATASLVDRDGEEIAVKSDPETGEFLLIDNSNEGILGAFVHHNDYQCGSVGCVVTNYFLDKPVFYPQEKILKKCDSVISENPKTTIYFEFDSDELSENSQNILKEFLKDKAIDKIKLKAIGHADEKGTDEFNYSLSLKRAENTSKFLKKLGIKSNQIKIEAKGKTQLISQQDEENRRVEILLINN
jgi:OmpA-OmpF porin, OOP family